MSTSAIWLVLTEIKGCAYGTNIDSKSMPEETNFARKQRTEEAIISKDAKESAPTDLG